MKKRFILLQAVLCMTTTLQAIEKPAYILYDSQGNNLAYQSMVLDVQTADIVFFGEMHTDPIAHWLQFELTKDLHRVQGNDLTIGVEMFEADDQIILDEYLEGLYSEKKFEAEVKMWNNFVTDYKPVLDYSKANNLRYIATNIPRRYASMIHHGGFSAIENLSEEAISLIGPRLRDLYDPTVPAYANMMQMQGMGEHVNDNFPKAQAAKDATMAHFILKNLDDKGLFLHFNGAYHSDNYEGIVWWINQISPDLEVKTITTVYQDDIATFSENNLNRADYIIAVPSNMTRSNR